MKKTFTLASALLIGLSSFANGKEIDTKAVNSSNAAPVVAVASSTSLAEVTKENQLLKLALQKLVSEKDGLADQLDFTRNMYFTTVGLYENELQKQQEDTKMQNSFNWMMHNVLLNLNAENAAK